MEYEETVNFSKEGNLDEDVILELKNHEEKLRNFEINISNFSDLQKMTETFISSLNTSTIHELDDSQSIYRKLNSIVNMLKKESNIPENIIEIFNSYTEVIKKLLNAVAFQRWIIKYMFITNKKYMSLLKEHEKRYVEFQELKVKTNLFDKFIEEFRNQMKEQREMFKTALFLKINEVTQTVNSLIERVNEIEDILDVKLTKGEKKVEKIPELPTENGSTAEKTLNQDVMKTYDEDGGGEESEERGSEYEIP